MIDDLAAFIGARLDEYEARAWAVHDVERCDALLYAEDMADAARRDPGCDCGQPARALRDVAAKQAILADCVRIIGPHRAPSPYASPGTPYGAPAANLAFRTLRSLASAYDTHPDYRREWKP